MNARDRYNTAAFIEVSAKDSPNGVAFCWNVAEQKAIFSKDSVDESYFDLFVAAPVLFQTLDILAVRLSKLNEVLLTNGIDAADEIDYLITSAIDAQKIATDGLQEMAARRSNDERKLK